MNIESYSLEVVVNGKIELLSNIRFNIDVINDFKGVNSDDIDIMNKTDFDWWTNYIEQYNRANDLIIELLDEAGLDIKEEYHNYINNIEFNELPTAMMSFYRENSYSYISGAIQELLNIQFEDIKNYDMETINTIVFQEDDIVKSYLLDNNVDEDDVDLEALRDLQHLMIYKLS